MKLRSIRIINLRNHEQFEGIFSPTVTLIHGSNGSGKTSILEAIYIAYRGTSFRSADQEVLSIGKEWYRIETTDTEEIERVVTFDNRYEKSRKQFLIDHKTHLRLPMKNRYPIVLFLPDDTRLINGSPSRRRKYLDTVISQYQPHYSNILHRYERALLQRNRLLKQSGVAHDQLFAWDVILSNLGAEIISARVNYIERVNQSIQQYYRRVAKTEDEISMHYLSPHGHTAQSLLDNLQHSRAHDFLTGSTSVGPHRHDISIRLRSQAADSIASRGEVRTIILALKYIEADIIVEASGKHPLILLDDVFGELDKTRQTQLLTSFSESQVIITSTEKHTTHRRINL